MRWLSIIDLNTGHQPISNEDQSLRVFNGEIYNYRDSARIYQPAVTILLLKRV
jgi:asparagine synthase (glutamine-hydrolysing)